jgi:UDP-GlcNAc:undecaprenyl-phosphate GlcNAc-1-phosphate transferase
MNSNLLLTLSAFAAAFLFSCLLTPLVRRLSTARGFVSVPRNDRYNRKVIALGGGIAIFACLHICTILYIGRFDARPEIGVLLLSAAGLFIVGLIDDIKHLGPFVKLFFQFALAALAVFAGGARVELFIESRFLTGAMSIVWIVLLINAFNFLDNMDGVSAGIATIVLLILSSTAILTGDYSNALLALITAGTLTGFLIYNYPPAKIFMGDAGSLSIGFIVAVLTLRITYYNETSSGDSRAAVLIPLIAVAVPLYDFLSVTFLRIRQGKSPFRGDTQHFSHRLKRRGLTDAQVALTLYLATLCTGLGAVFLSRASFAQAICIFAQTIMILGIIAILEKNSGHK